MKWEEVKELQEDKFKRLIGVGRKTFEKMVEILRVSAIKSNHKHSEKKRSPKHKLCSEDHILVMLMYFREYRTFFHTAHSFGISESHCWRIVTNTEKVLIKDNSFHVPGKKRLLSEDIIEVVLIDATETPIERPRKTKKFYSGKKKKHTLKTQLIVNAKNKEIISIAGSEGKKHDFVLLKESKNKSRSRFWLSRI